MSDSSTRFLQIFFEVFEALPRQGPGSRASAIRALAFCSDLPPSARILDLGCGAGGQTVQLAELTSGTIVALDRHAPFIVRLRAQAMASGLADRLTPIIGDMANPDLPPQSFDLIWSEGALYNLGLANALRTCFDLLRPGGYLAFTDAVWRAGDPPPEVKASFDQDYPTMGRVADVRAEIEQANFELIGNFTLPDEAWWDDFYTPMERRIAELRDQYAGDVEALAMLDELAQEPEMHRRHSSFYAYEFFVARRRVK